MRALLLLVCVSVMFGACATHKHSVDLPAITDWDQRQQVLAAVHAWSFQGRIAVKAGDEGFNGKLRWTQEDDAFFATVGGPLGIGTVKIDGDGQSVTLTDKNNDKTVLRDVEAELFVRYGWTIPIARLRFWALGIPDPSSPATTEVDSDGRLQRLEQSGWVVEINDYRQGGGTDMPRKMTASNANTRVRLVISRWLFSER